MSRIYVAAPLPLIAHAKAMAIRLEVAGHDVISSWHDGAPTVESEGAIGPGETRSIADTCVHEVLESDALVLLYGPETTRHGSVLEAGIAIGDGLRLIVCPVTPDAVLPTILLNADFVRHCGVDDVERWLA